MDTFPDHSYSHSSDFLRSDQYQTSSIISIRLPTLSNEYKRIPQICPKYQRIRLHFSITSQPSFLSCHKSSAPSPTAPIPLMTYQLSLFSVYLIFMQRAMQHYHKPCVNGLGSTSHSILSGYKYKIAVLPDLLG